MFLRDVWSYSPDSPPPPRSSSLRLGHCTQYCSLGTVCRALTTHNSQLTALTGQSFLLHCCICFTAVSASLYCVWRTSRRLARTDSFRVLREDLPQGRRSSAVATSRRREEEGVPPWRSTVQGASAYLLPWCIQPLGAIHLLASIRPLRTN